MTPAKNCAKSINNSNLTFEKIPACIKLNKDLSAIQKSKLFNDISFDYGVLNAIEAIDFTSEFTWNISNVKVEDIDKITPNKFKFIILNNNDPNKY